MVDPAGLPVLESVKEGTADVAAVSWTVFLVLASEVISDWALAGVMDCVVSADDMMLRASGVTSGP